ncbi:SRPBCC family protein [Roseovarius aestuariivivens]|uniref:SRPBCC family protein n=1 Tax=Roseovarius aestuariivivens TaxID=1888910 RepID=UPI00108088C3|nr:SRPBCC family protein [Roseovarius aestuariivivens]
MKFIKRLFIGCVVAIVLLAGVGLLLPREISVARSIVIDAPASAVFPHVNDLQATVDWSPWLARDPDTSLEFSADPVGEGARMSWASDNPQVGTGTMTITESRPDDYVEVALDFGDMGTATASWDFQEADGATTATWSMQTDMGAGPVNRWFGVMMKRWIADDYDAGLQNLKQLVEAKGG